MNDFSHMAWEPRIMKHGPHYDNPFFDVTNTGTMPNRKVKPILVYDTKTLQIIDYKSIFIAAEAIGSTPSNVRQSANKNCMTSGRYIFAYTIAQLFNTMAKHNYS